MPKGHAPSAVLGWPRHRSVSRLEEVILPGAVGVEAVFALSDGQAGWLVGFEPVGYFATEGSLLSGVKCVLKIVGHCFPRILDAVDWQTLAEARFVSEGVSCEQR